ncbi:MAG: hypothetical protein M1833_001792 [Piccolia ochrophora]|nr:MAG: hypothetical protein M1833_001792 [Piccolia ochrophora]
MKFAKELEEDLVPEWRLKYFDYKIGKKKLKAVARALRGVNATPRFARRRSVDAAGRSSLSGLSVTPSPYDKVPPHSFLHHSGSVGPTTLDNVGQRSPPRSPSDDESVRADASGETRRLHDVQDVPTYGSLGPSPANIAVPKAPSTLNLPDPAIDPGEHGSNAPSTGTPNAMAGASPHNAYEVGKTHGPPGVRRMSRARTLFASRRSASNPDHKSLSLSFSRLLGHSHGHGHTVTRHRNGAPTIQRDVPLEAYREFDLRQAQFFTWMDKELEKVEGFYRDKENEASDRLVVLRDQLHIMRDRRLQEVEEAERAKNKGKSQQGSLEGTDHRTNGSGSASDSNTLASRFSLFGQGTRFSMTTKSFGDIGSSSAVNERNSCEEHRDTDSRRDFVRRRIPNDDVPYRHAKRKLKLALSEFYRGLELLKSYALLNRTAFRKINKKYDKTVQVRPTGRYMTEKVNNSWFVQSTLLETHMQVVEDLYARYFEKGNHKIAVGKLRRKDRRYGDYYANVHRNGLLVGGGLVFGIQGLVAGASLLSDPQTSVRIQTAYLLQVTQPDFEWELCLLKAQIYAGYFLALFLFILFTLACRLWTMAKINYVFIFEFDTRHHLDWRQLSELPCLFLFLEGLFIWLNFGISGPQTLFIWYPVILMGLTLLVLCIPAPVLYHRSRTWWLYSNWRLVLAGLYPVEFRDFFLGDMYCSQTYAMGNIELFFCLYARDWNDPVQCNSNHSRLLGFFSTLPGIWRGLQCLRRYYDTRNIFPHLVNGGKYTFTVLAYMTLSLYRVNKTPQLRALFIFCSVINSIYCSIWDLAMDWSLGNPYARHPLLRDTLGYGHAWVYYAAMIIDPILRFNWIFYAIYGHDVQHSAILSFLVSLSEVMRRGMWMLFRVENEHCTNVGRFRASRDLPLPYDISVSSVDTANAKPVDLSPVEEDDPAVAPTKSRSTGQPTPDRPPLNIGADLERAPTNPTQRAGSLRRRQTIATVATSPLQRGITRVGTLITQAHAQDFERRNKGEVGHGVEKDDRDGPVDASSDEEDEDYTDLRNAEDVGDAEDLLERGKGHGGGTRP